MGSDGRADAVHLTCSRPAHRRLAAPAQYHGGSLDGHWFGLVWFDDVVISTGIPNGLVCCFDRRCAVVLVSCRGEIRVAA